MGKFKSQFCRSHHTFSVWGSVPWEYVGILQFSDVVQADAEADVVDDLRRWEQRFNKCRQRQ